MPRRKSTRSTSSTSEVVSSELFENDETINITLLPNLNTSDVEDDFESENDDDDIENDNYESEKIFFDNEMSHREVFENYTENQKYLEKNHEYRWVEGKKRYNDKLINEYLLTE